MSKHMQDKENQITLFGTIVADKWDRNNDIIAIALEKDEYERYLIDTNEKGEELMDFINEQVKVTGVPRENKKGKKIISVIKYSVIE